MNYGLALNVLGYREDGQWCALALDMDLRGYGESFEAALEELQGCVVTQIEFALFKKQPGMVWFPADKKYFEMFEQARQAGLAALANGGPKPLEECETTAAGLQLPPAYQTAARPGEVQPANA